MSEERRAFWKKFIIANWFVLIALAAYLYGRTGIPFKEIPEALRGYIEHHERLGPLVFIALYTFRPLVFFPAVLMTMAAGLMWGPFWGIAFSLVGENLSAAFAFWMGRWLGKEFLEESGVKFIHGLNRHLREHGFLTVIILRLTYMPFDVVNFACGLTKMHFWEYAAGTFIGVIPGVITFIFFGAAWFDKRNLLISGTVFGVGLLIAYFMKHTETGRQILKSAKF